MIPAKIVAEVQRLLVQPGLSHRKIAQITGVSRGSVGAIASGKRPDYAMPRSAGAEDCEEPTGPPRRCPGCGGMVYMPCVLCRVRETTAARRQFAAVEDRDSLDVNLRPEHRARFEVVLARRREMGGLEVADRATSLS
jgi:hypothetical protein